MLRMRRSSLDSARLSIGAPLENGVVDLLVALFVLGVGAIVWGPGGAGGNMDGGGAKLPKEEAVTDCWLIRDANPT